MAADDNMEDLKAAFRTGLASQSNAELLASYKPVCERFSKELKRVLARGDTERLKYLGSVARLHMDALDSWIDGVMKYSPDSNLLILRDYWQESADDIIAAQRMLHIPV